ncbi:MAG: hypothetical protein JEZ00_21345 [Anaerolineaceae bacterium]|nr:hypothetical protein [Anaerolineaceae bacterium]
MSNKDENNEILVEETEGIVLQNDAGDESDDEQPVFYDPVKVLQADQWLKWAAYAIVVATTLGNLLSVQSFVENVSYVLIQSPTPNTLVWIVGIVLFLIVVAASCAILYFPLRALGSILKILMEMEFNSRGVKE